MIHLIFFISFYSFMLSEPIVIKAETNLIITGEFKNGMLLGVPTQVATFSDGSFIINEYQDFQLKHFTETGDFIKSIGNRGRGPGEFLSIENIFVDHQDQLLVFDHILGRVTVFDGKEISNEYNIFSSRPSIRSIHQKKDGNFVLGLRKYHLRGTEEGEYIFYELDSSLSFTGEYFVNRSHLHNDVPGSLPDHVITGSSRFTDKSALTIDDDLVVAPMLFSGQILVYRKKHNYSFPEFLHSQNYGPAFEEFSPTRNINADIMRHELLNLLSGPGYRRVFYHLNKSHGIFKTNSGEIIHFVETWENNKPVFYVELFNKNATNLLKIKRLTTLGDLNIENSIISGNKYGMFNFSILHMDERNNLYVFVENDNHEPELHVVSIQINR